MRWVLLTIIVLAVAVVVATYLFPGAVYRGAMAFERNLAGLETRQLTLDDGTQVVYTDRVRGTPLLLLHGFTADKDHWTRLARHLDDDIRVIAPDLPGFGASTRNPDADYSIEAQLRWLDQFIDRLGLQRFDIGGSSMGGNIAFNYAARHPDRVSSLWLLAPGGVQSPQQSDMEKVLLDGGANPLIPVDRDSFERTLDFVFVHRPWLPSPLRGYLARDAATRRPLREQIFDDILNEERTAFTPLLNAIAPTVQVPTLVTWGARDRILQPEGAEVLAGLMPKVEVVVMPDTGHLPMLEAPRRTAAIYQAFRQSVPR